MTWLSFEVIVTGETGEKINILGVAVPNGDSKNRQLIHAMDAEIIHAVGAVSGTCCKGWLKLSCGGWHGSMWSALVLVIKAGTFEVTGSMREAKASDLPVIALVVGKAWDVAVVYFVLVVITWEYAVIVVVLVGKVWAVVAMASVLEKA